MTPGEGRGAETGDNKLTVPTGHRGAFANGVEAGREKPCRGRGLDGRAEL